MGVAECGSKEMEDNRQNGKHKASPLGDTHITPRGRERRGKK